MRCALRMDKIAFAYPGAATMLIEEFSAEFHPGWSGIVGANGSGKTTLLMLAAGLLEPLSGRVTASGPVVYCPQRTDEPPRRLAALLAAAASQALALRGRLGIEDDYLVRWGTLSHGQRKRSQVAAALWARPDVLALDEPTNHLDADAAELLGRELRSFGGVGLLVSHDRALLDGLCRRCVFGEAGRWTLRPGGYTQGRQAAELERDSALHARGQAAGELRKLRQESHRRREKAAGEHRVRSKRGLARKDHDARARIDAARVADSKAGAPLRALAGRRRQAVERLADLHVEKRYEGELWLPDSRSARARLLRLEAGLLPLGPQARLHFPELTMRPDDRIALTGPNGSGKSTLVRRLTEACDLPPEQVLVIPQEIDAAASAAVLRSVRALQGERLGRLMNVVSRLGSRPQGLLESELPSPGEVRKLMLALGAVNASCLIIMDEPTNHLDLPSIERLESALSACRCGLLLVSHDRRFLRALCRRHWSIARPDAGDATLSVEMEYMDME